MRSTNCASRARAAVDDAGAGYAGLQQILRLRPDIVKLDVEFTRTIDADPVRRALATSLVTFGRDTGEVIIAEGIETLEEFDTLGRLGSAGGRATTSPGPARWRITAWSTGSPARSTDSPGGRVIFRADGRVARATVFGLLLSS